MSARFFHGQRFQQWRRCYPRRRPAYIRKASFERDPGAATVPFLKRAPVIHPPPQPARVDLLGDDPTLCWMMVWRQSRAKGGTENRIRRGMPKSSAEVVSCNEDMPWTVADCDGGRSPPNSGTTTAAHRPAAGPRTFRRSTPG